MPANLLQPIIDVGTRLVGAKYGALGIMDGSRTRLTAFITSGLSREERMAIGPLPEGKGILGVLIHQPDSLRLDDIGADPRSVGFPPNHPPMRSFLGVPLVSEEEVYGNLYFAEKIEGGAFTAKDEEIARTFAGLAVSAIEHAQALAEAHRSMSLFRSVVDENPDAVIITDAHRRIVFANTSAEKLFRYSPGELNGKNATDLLPPESHDAWPEMGEKETLAHMRGGASVHFEALRLRKDGTRAPCSILFSPVRDAEGDLAAISCVYKDLSEKRRTQESLEESERRYSDMLENARLIAVSLDRNGRVVFCNDFLLDLTGWREEEILGHDWFDLFIPEEERETMRRLFAQNLEQGMIPPHHENPILTRDGKTRVIAWNNTLLRGDGGEPSGTTSIGVDLTERILAEAQLRQGQKLEAIGSLAAGVAHDFNNALGIISGNAELLGRLLQSGRGGSPDAPALIDAILKTIDSSALTVRRLQDFARKRIDPPIGFADVNTAVQMVADITRPRWKNEMESRGFTVDMAVEPRARRPLVQGETEELEEVLINLVNNALDAMPAGGHLVLATADTPEGTRVTVTDDGEGMSPQVRERALEPFFTTKGEMGTGLGLSTAYGIISRYGGTLRIESTQGKGTSVSFVLPPVEEQDSAG